MTRATVIALSLGVALFVALLAWQGFGPVIATLEVAGWGLVLVAAFHWVPVILDAAAIRVLWDRRDTPATMRDATLARWAGEAANSLLPLGQIGGPVLMARQLAQRGLRSADAGAVITVSTTLQTFAQMVFTVAGLIVLALGQGAVGTSGSVYLHVHQAGHQAGPQALDLREPLAAATLAFALLLGGFYLAQRRGLFGGMARLAAKFRSKTDWSSLQQKAEAIDAAVQALYRHRRRALASFALSLLGWAVGTVEVWLILQFIGHPLGWVDALLLESLGQAIRGAAFMIPGSLGVQEGGYLLLGPLVGLPPEAALALSLAKRSRELLLGLPGIVYLHFSERGWQRRRARQLHATDQTVS